LSVRPGYADRGGRDEAGARRESRDRARRGGVLRAGRPAGLSTNTRRAREERVLMAQAEQTHARRLLPVSGTVVSIHIAPDAGEPMATLVKVEALAGAGLVGDRYFRGRGTYSTEANTGRQITLIESEALDAASDETGMRIQPRDSR